MISYKMWKLAEANEPDIDGLVNSAVSDIERAVNDYLAKIKPQSNQTKDKVSNFGKKVKQGIGNYLGQAKQGVNNYLDKTVGMSSKAGEPAVGVTRRDMIAKNYPALDTLVHGTGKVPKNSTWWRHLGDRLSGFFNKKEWLDIASTHDVQSVLIECGVIRLLLSESNEEFGGLLQVIHKVLKELGMNIRATITKSK